MTFRFAPYSITSCLVAEWSFAEIAQREICILFASSAYMESRELNWNVSAESISSGPSPRLPKETICFQFGYVKA